MNADLLWNLATALLLPLLGGLVLYIRQTESKGRDRAEKLAKELSDYKTHVAEHYATNDYIKEVDNRFAERLSRIETKLDRLIERDAS